MTKLQYLESGCNNYHCKFFFENGDIVYGVITNYYHSEPENYYLVPSLKLVEFKPYMDSKNFEKMKEFTRPVNLSQIIRAERLDSFGELIAKKNQELETNKINWDERRDIWLTSILTFYNQIRGWLNDLEKGNLLRIDEKQINLQEEFISFYSTTKLEIYLGHDTISLTPKGTFIIGSYGRIDMRGPKGLIMIVERSWNEWKFVKRSPSLTQWDVTEMSFKEAIQELINV